MGRFRCKVKTPMGLMLSMTTIVMLAGANANPTGVVDLPPVDEQPVFDFLGATQRNGFHFREGGHAQSEEDWRALVDFADQQFFGKKVGRRFDVLPFPDAEKAFTWTAPGASQ